MVIVFQGLVSVPLDSFEGSALLPQGPVVFPAVTPLSVWLGIVAVLHQPLHELAPVLYRQGIVRDEEPGNKDGSEAALALLRGEPRTVEVVARTLRRGLEHLHRVRLRQDTACDGLHKVLRPLHRRIGPYGHLGEMRSRSRQTTKVVGILHGADAYLVAPYRLSAIIAEDVFVGLWYR